MDGFYFSRTASVQSKTIDELPKQEKGFTEEIIVPSQRSNNDTILLITGARIPCTIETITKRKITYSNSREPWNKKIVRNKKVSSIHFNGQQREYFKERHSEGNPILQFGLVKETAESDVTTGTVGYILLLISSLGAVAITPVFLFFTILFLGLLIGINTMNHETVGFKIINGFGKFISYLSLSLLGLALLIIIIALLFLLA